MFTMHVDKSLTRYSDGELTAAEEGRIDAHLASCSKCRAALDEIQFSARLVRQLSEVNAPSSVWNGIDAALAESRSDGSAYGGTRPTGYVFGRPLRVAQVLVPVDLDFQVENECLQRATRPNPGVQARFLDCPLFTPLTCRDLGLPCQRVKCSLPHPEIGSSIFERKPNGLIYHVQTHH